MIKLESVSKYFKSVAAVDRLDLTVADGEVFGFLGPNGAGKTTTLKMIAGLLRPSSGSIWIDQFDLAADPIEAKRITAYIPDKPFVYEKLTGSEFLEFTAELYGKKGDRRAEEILGRLEALFGLKGRLDELVETYSHGMRQKLAITAALLTSPKALVIDEPMVGLDARGVRQVKELFRELARAGASVLLSTHTMSVAQAVCDRIGILSEGRLLAVGELDRLRAMVSSENSDLESIFLELTESSQSDLDHNRAETEPV